MAKYQALKNITHIPGLIIIKFPDGSKRTFKNSTEALRFYELNYGDGYSLVISAQGDNNGEIIYNGGELPEIEVVAQAPERKEPEPRDPVRDAIFEGRYNGRRFTPTPENILHFLDLYDSDKRIAEGYGGKAWGKVAGVMGLGALTAYGAAATAPVWAPWLTNTAAPFVTKHFVAPALAGTIWDESQRALTGTTTTEQISHWLQEKKGWNPILADMTGGLSNPGYWINFGGTGLYTRPFFNKNGIGVAKPGTFEALSPEMQARVMATLPKSTFQTKVVQPALNWTDRNLYRFQALSHPWLLRHKPTTFNSEELPRFNFVRDPAKMRPLTDNERFERPKPGQMVDYLLFRSDKNNKQVFGDAMALSRPKVNTTFYTLAYDGGNLVDDIGTNILAGISATDIALSDDDRNPYIRGLEYLTLGRSALNNLATSRLRSTVGSYTNYGLLFMNLNWKLHQLFSKNPNISSGGYLPYYRTRGLGHLGSIYVQPGSHKPIDKAGFNYRGATFDDLIKFLDKNLPKNSALKPYSVIDGKLYDESGSVIAKRATNGKIELVNETELRNILSKDVDIFDYVTGNRFTGKISVGNDGTVSMPEEYQRILRSNIDYVQNTLFPGSGIKVFGSSAGVTEAGFPHATHDIDFYITQNELNKLMSKGVLSESNRINPGTYTYRLNPSKFGLLGNIDLNVLEQTPEGMATGIRAEELYRQYFPDEYFQALRDFKTRLSNGDADLAFHISRTPEELLGAMEPSSKTIMDAFDIDYTAPAKGKHALRSWAHLVYSDPAQVSQGLNQYAQSMLGSRVQLFPISVLQLGNKELNLLALEKLGIRLKDFELDRIASDPQRMKNVLDAWYMMDNTAMRYIRGTWPGTSGYSSENFIRSATEWDPVNNGGNANGAGLNTTIGGDSKHYGDLKAFISPNTQYKSTNLLDLIDEVNNNFGRSAEAPTLLSRASYGTPEEQVRNLQSIYNTRGWNFLLNGRIYGTGQYASATRPFDVNTDYIGFSPLRTTLYPLIPRINPKPENHPLTSWRSPLAAPRTIYPELDYSKAKFSSLSPVFTTNENQLLPGYYKPTNFGVRDVPDWRYTIGSTVAIPGVVGSFYGLGLGIISLQRRSRRSDVNKWLTEPDLIILNMPEEDRRMFTPEGVDSILLKYREQYGRWHSSYSQDNLDDAVYYDLSEIRDKYNK